MIEKRGKTEAWENLIRRQNYLVVQGNDLAKSFGNLSAFELRILDYCFSCVTKESKRGDVFRFQVKDVLQHYGINSSGQNYERIAVAMKHLNEKSLFIPTVEKDGQKSIIMTQLFNYVKFVQNGRTEFEFSEKIAPYVFELKRNFYYLTLSELARVKGKYAIILLKLWCSYRKGDSRMTVITDTLEEWQKWFLGEDRRMSSSAFKNKILRVAAEELETKFQVDFALETKKNGRVVVGYTMEITDLKQTKNS